MHLYLTHCAIRLDAIAAHYFKHANKAFLSGCFCFLIGSFGSAYYVQSIAENITVENITVENITAEMLVAVQPEPSDIWDSMREGFQLPDLDSSLVTRQINQYVASGSHLQDSFASATPYLYFILDEVKKRGMPTELAMLPLIESGFNIRIGNNLNHAGLWGLMPITARHLNLDQTPFKDERRDIIASTTAALNLLQELHEKFGDWHLALAAYNWGPGSLAKAIEYNRNRKIPITYTHLKMPVETMIFVPKLLAIRKIIEDPERFNVKLPAIPNRPYFVQLDVKDAIDIPLVIKLAGITQKEFVQLNPSFNKPLIPAGPNQKLLLPLQKITRYLEHYQAYNQALSPWRTVIVETPQTLDALAKAWKVDPIPTRQLNGFRRGTILEPGTTVVIPAPSHKSD